MLISRETIARRTAIENKMAPGYRHGGAASLLADAYAVAVTVAERIDDVDLRADLYVLAATIDHHLQDCLSVLVLSRDDVLDRFSEMRATRPWWPDSISVEAWGRLEATRYLRDITDVVLDGGDFWTAIELALEDEYGWNAPVVG